jgi:hypothetical protein
MNKIDGFCKKEIHILWGQICNDIQNWLYSFEITITSRLFVAFFYTCLIYFLTFNMNLRSVNKQVT